MTETNYEIKSEALRHGVRLYQIAQHLGISESCFNQKLRSELSDEDREKFTAAIKELSKSKQ